MVGDPLTGPKTSLATAAAAMSTPAIDWLGWTSRGVTLVAGVLGIILTAILIREHWAKSKLAEMEVEDHDKKAPPST